MFRRQWSIERWLVVCRQRRQQQHTEGPVLLLTTMLYVHYYAAVCSLMLMMRPLLGWVIQVSVRWQPFPAVAVVVVSLS